MGSAQQLRQKATIDNQATYANVGISKHLVAQLLREPKVTQLYHSVLVQENCND